MMASNIGRATVASQSFGPVKQWNRACAIVVDPFVSERFWSSPMPKRMWPKLCTLVFPMTLPGVKFYSCIQLCQLAILLCRYFSFNSVGFFFCKIIFTSSGSKCTERAWCAGELYNLVESLLYANGSPNHNDRFSRIKNFNIRIASGCTEPFWSTLFWHRLNVCVRTMYICECAYSSYRFCVLKSEILCCSSIPSVPVP